MTRYKGIGTEATSGWSLYGHPGEACEVCNSSKRTLYCAPINRHDPDEGVFVICFLCLLENLEDMKHRYL